MGDRCNCTLLLKEAPTQELLRLMDEHLGDPQELDERYFSFEEVNYAHLPEPIEVYLVGHQLEAAWTNTAGSEYGDGVTMFPSGRSWITNNGEIALQLSEINAQNVDLAGKDQALLEELRA